MTKHINNQQSSQDTGKKSGKNSSFKLSDIVQMESEAQPEGVSSIKNKIGDISPLGWDRQPETDESRDIYMITGQMTGRQKQKESKSQLDVAKMDISDDTVGL